MSDETPTPPCEESLGDKLIRMATAAKDAVVGAMTEKIPPSQVTGLRVTQVSPTHVSLAWNQPATGTLPIHYTVFLRDLTSQFWSVGAVTASTAAEITSLQPQTRYYFEVLAHNT